MREVTKLFMDLCNTQGTNAKQDFVKKYKDNLEFIKSLKFLLSTDNPTGISSKKYDKWEEVSMFDDENVPNLKATLDNLFDYLEVNNTGRDTDIRWVHSFVNSWSECDEDKEFLRKIICKDYPIGIDVKGVNKAIPNLIPTWDVMLADKFLDLDEKALMKISKNGTRKFVLQEKLDGFRNTALFRFVKEGNSVKFMTRQGKPYERLVELENALKNSNIDDGVFDGELILTDRNSIPSGEQYKATSKLVTVKDTDIHGVTMNVFDFVPMEEWESKKCKTPYSERYAMLKKIFSENKLEPYFHLVENIYEGNDLDVVMKELTKAKEKNWEGLMLRWCDSVYEFKRSKELLKVKPFQEMDVYIKGYEEGTNKNIGKLGAFICEIEHPTFGHLEMKVGSGYSDEDRVRYWEHKDELIGRVLEMQYFEVTSNADGGKSVRFPVHKCIKPIGTEPNN